MNNDKRLKKIITRSLLDSIARSLHRQAVASEQCVELYARAVGLQKAGLALADKNVAAAQQMVRIASRNYEDRLLAATRQATMTDEAP